MNYIMIGFMLAIGWTLGEAVMRIVSRILIDTIENATWFQETIGKKRAYNCEAGDAKVVKNQIGFR